MEVYLLCIAIDGTDDRVAWSTFIVEPEGFVEERSGLASSYERAILWAIKEGLCGVPSTAHVAVRSVSGPVLRLGKNALSSRPNDTLFLENADLVSAIIERANGQTLAWVHPPFLEAGDSRAIKIAKEIIRDPMSSYPPEEVDFIMQSYEHQESPAVEDSYKEEQQSPQDEDNDSSYEEISKPQLNREIHTEFEEINEKKQDIRCEKNIVANPENLSNPSLDDPIDQSPKDSNPISATKTYKPTLKSKLPPPAKKTQLHVEGPDYLFGARILAYVDGIGSGNLGAWAFVLVDRKTGFALARASGMRASTPYRARLIACIEVLSALKAFNQEIEIRCRWQKLIKLGDQWMQKWKNKNWKKSGNEPIQEVGYIQQLDSLCSQHRMSWLYIPDHNDEHGIQFCKHLVKNALNDINSGHKHIHSERIKDFPVDKLL